MSTETDWGRLTAAQLRDLAARDAIVVLPVGATEQHGPHLPTMVDSHLVHQIGLRAARAAGDREPVVVAPVIPFGLSEHHVSLGGTLTLDFATLHAILRGLTNSLKRQGFRRLFVLNGHGGNVAALDVIVGELTVEFGLPIAGGSYWELAAEQIATIVEGETVFGHCGEGETAMMMASAGVTLTDEQLAECRGEFTHSKSFIEGVHPAVTRWRHFASSSANGVLGDGRRADRDKGERLLAAIGAAVADAVVDPKLWSAPT